MTVTVLPDSERRTTYDIVSASTGPYDVDFDIWADGTDYAQWIEVWDDGVKLTAVSQWQLDSPSGSLATLTRPITDARITFATARSGTIEIIGARRPRRTTQFTAGAAVPADDHNRAYSDLMATAREEWDRRPRTLTVPPGETIASLPSLADRQNKEIRGFDADGNLSLGPVTVVDVTSADVTVDTMADLLALAPGTDVNTIRVNNYYDDIFGGGGVWFYDPSATVGYRTTFNGRKYSLLTLFGLWPEQLGARGDLGDDTAALQEWALHPETQKFANRTYFHNESIVFAPNTDLVCGPSCRFTADPAGTYTDAGLRFGTGSLTELPALASNATVGEAALVFASAPDLVAGDVVLIVNPANGSWAGFRDYYNAGEMVEVRSVDTVTATLNEKLEVLIATRYDKDDVVLFRMPRQTFRVIGLRADGPGTTDIRTVAIRCCKNPIFQDFEIVSPHPGTNENFIIEQCYRPSLHRGTAVNNGANTSKQYAGYLNATKHASIHECKWSAAFIPLTVAGGAPQDGNIPCWHTVINRCVINGDADIHGNSAYTTYNDCTVGGALALGGFHSRNIGCTSGESGIQQNVCVIGAEVAGGVHEVNGCTLTTLGDPSGASQAVIEFGGVSGAVTADTKDTVLLRIRNTVVNAPNAQDSLIQVGNYSSPFPLNIDIDGLSGSMPNGSKLLKALADGGTTSSTSLRIQNVNAVYLAAGALILYVPTGSEEFVDSDTDYDLQAQSGAQDVVLTTGGSGGTHAGTTFRWSYPVTPNVCQITLAGRKNDDDASKIIADIFAVDNASIRTGATRADMATLVDTQTVTVSWTVSMRGKLA